MATTQAIFYTDKDTRNKWHQRGKMKTVFQNGENIRTMRQKTQSLKNISTFHRQRKSVNEIQKPRWDPKIGCVQ